MLPQTDEELFSKENIIETESLPYENNLPGIKINLCLRTLKASFFVKIRNEVTFSLEKLGSNFLLLIHL